MGNSITRRINIPKTRQTYTNNSESESDENTEHSLNMNEIAISVAHNLKQQRHYGTYRTIDYKNVNYSITSIIGKGSFGIVYGIRNEFNEEYALKCKKELRDEDLMKKSTLLFRGELDALYNLNHPCIVKLIGVEFKRNEVFGLVMEHVQGERLDKLIRKYMYLNETYVQLFTRQLIDAVAYMHSKYIMHRDIKSTNVIIVNKTLLKLIDFGMAKHFDVSDNSLVDYEACSSTIVGTLPYMAPELQISGKYNSKIDVWSLGVIIFEMATGDVFVKFRNNYSTNRVTLSQIMERVYVASMSSLANNFLQYCLIKNANVRPAAFTLLNHPFISNNSMLLSPTHNVMDKPSYLLPAKNHRIQVA